MVGGGHFILDAFPTPSVWMNSPERHGRRVCRATMGAAETVCESASRTVWGAMRRVLPTDRQASADPTYDSDGYSGHCQALLSLLPVVFFTRVASENGPEATANLFGSVTMSTQGWHYISFLL